MWTGDNLDVMRGMNSDCIDLIYLDPPFNSNRNYEAPMGGKAQGTGFRDTWNLSHEKKEEHGQLAESHPAAYDVIRAAGSAVGKGTRAYLIFMAIRLLEMRRILKPTGSIYLHCDDAEAAWLKALMDAIFGRRTCRNTIIWKRTSAHNDPGRFGRIADTILFYGAGDINADAVRLPLEGGYKDRAYRHQDARGKYRHGDLTGAGKTHGESGKVWEFRDPTTKEIRSYDPTAAGRHWAVPRTGEYAQWIQKNAIPGYLDDQFEVHDRLKMLAENGFIYWSKNGIPSLKRYLEGNPGQVPGNIWTDIQPVTSGSKEDTTWATQKPLKLMERIIKASSAPGDMVFDPFCGCATTLVAAQRLGRRWAGCDLEKRAISLVNERIAEDKIGAGGLAKAFKAIIPGALPIRDDQGNVGNPRGEAHTLYGKQEGICKGCDEWTSFKFMEVDHIVPKVKGGSDHPDNLQLLCGHCNKSKGGRTMTEWRASQKTGSAIARAEGDSSDVPA